jgi:hypothetical protein
MNRRFIAFVRRRAPSLPLGGLAIAAALGTACTAPEPSARGPTEPPPHAESEIEPPTDGCSIADDCAPDHNCVPRTCVMRRDAVLDQACEETGPPIGDCECVEGRCVEVPFDAPNGRNHRR